MTRPEARGASPYRRVQVIVNPVSGRDRPILNVLNGVFDPVDLDWDVSVTRRTRGARELAAGAVEEGADLVAVYGGDGTVMEAAAGLIGTSVPIAILPGGTSNALAQSLGIPQDLAVAARLILPGNSSLQAIDVGRLPDRYFLVGVGVGIPGEVAATAEREEKGRFGTLSYLVRGLQALGRARGSLYSLTLDGEHVEVEGVTCIVANTGGFGLPGLSLAPTIYMDDGLFDVLVIRDTDIGSILSVAASVLQLDGPPPGHANGATHGAAADNREGLGQGLSYWQAREVTVTADPPQAVQADGEVLKAERVEATVLARAVRILVPSDAGTRASPV